MKKLYKASRNYTCCCGCDEMIKIGDQFHIITGEFYKKGHIPKTNEKGS